MDDLDDASLAGYDRINLIGIRWGTVVGVFICAVSGTVHSHAHSGADLSEDADVYAQAVARAMELLVHGEEDAQCREGVPRDD